MNPACWILFKVTRDRKRVNLTLRRTNLDARLQCLSIEPFRFPTHENIHEWYVNRISVVVPHYNEALVKWLRHNLERAANK